MNPTSTTRWSPIVSAPDDEFGNFLEFGDLQLDFPSFERVAHDGRTDRQDVDADTSMDASMEHAPAMVDFGIGHMAQQPQQPTSNPLMNGYNGMGQLFNMQMSREQFHESQPSQAHIKTQRQYHSGMVPPTPNSIEMHGGMPGYYHTPMHHQPHAYEYYQRGQRDQVKPATFERNVAPELMGQTDGLHTIGVACGDASGHSISVRPRASRGKFQSLDVASAGSKESSQSIFSLWNSSWL